jgi:hypothetical protein
MRTGFAVGLVVLSAMPALAQDAPFSHLDQQACLTWLSLAARFGPEGEHDAMNDQYLRLNREVAARTDLSEEQRKSDAQPAIDTYNQWVLNHFNANDGTKATMVADVLAKAKDCAAMVPPDPDETMTPVQ